MRKKLRIVDVAACGNVTQPLFPVDKMWKLGWSTVREDGSLRLKKNGVRVPIYLEKNSSMASMSIYKVTQEKSQDPIEERVCGRKDESCRTNLRRCEKRIQAGTYS